MSDDFKTTRKERACVHEWAFSALGLDIRCKKCGASYPYNDALVARGWRAHAMGYPLHPQAGTFHRLGWELRENRIIDENRCLYEEILDECG